MLTTRQTDLLEALVNRIIPADAYPGGWEAGVGDYLLRQFERDLKALLPLYRLGLDHLDSEALAVCGQPFDQLAPESQDQLLAQIERGAVVTQWVIDPAAFFRAAAEHCAEGYYSDPGSGGNHGGVSWAMIGFEVRG